jgi:signal transduction histidine kinase
VQIVLENLLSNAIKYTPTTGSIALRLISDPEEMRFEVRDTGYGIPRHQQQHIFEKLFRADNVVKTDTVGTGLGLYIARFSVEAWGGKIWFESDEGHGTIFSFTVPRSMKKVEVAQKTVEYDALTPP